MADLVFFGGNNAANWGNQQFTMRNLTFNNAVIAINQIWDWGWTYKSITINNCSIGLKMNTDTNTGAQTVGSITMIDSSIRNTPLGVLSSRSNSPNPPSSGSYILENLEIANVNFYANDASGNSAGPRDGPLAGDGEGIQYNLYNLQDHGEFSGSLPGFARPANLLQSDGKYYERSKPQYQSEPLREIYSVRTGGARGDGVTDDTAALQHVINLAAALHKVVFFDFGVYRVTETLFFPAGSRIVGESYPVILSSGPVQLGHFGDIGSIEWSDMIVSTQGSQAGAILIEINFQSPIGSPTGLWDVHTRIGEPLQPYL